MKKNYYEDRRECNKKGLCSKVIESAAGVKQKPPTIETFQCVGANQRKSRQIQVLTTDNNKSKE